VSPLSLTGYGSLDALSPSARDLFTGPGSAGLFTSLPWLESFVAAALPRTASPLFLVLADQSGAALAALPCQRLSENGDRGPGDATVASLTSFYSCDFRPLLATSADPGATGFALGRAVARNLAAEPVVRFDSLDIASPGVEPFLSGLARPGRAILRYAHFGRWWENLDGSTFAGYLAGRDGALRETIRRKGARLDRAGAAPCMIGLTGRTGPDEIARGIADYEAVYAASWKEPEPFPDFQPFLMRRLAEAGWLRLALLRIGDKPIAAQLWVVVNRRATVLKLAHDSAFDSLSPGTVLTAYAIRTLMETDRIGQLDFGRGDDPYKRAWTSNRTAHIGALWTSIVRRPALMARHVLGSVKRRLPDA